jgi:hypothetical protein
MSGHNDIDEARRLSIIEATLEALGHTVGRDEQCRSSRPLRWSEWREPHFKQLKGDCEGLWEIRFKAGNVQQRPLGYRSGANEFTIVFWAEEKNNRWIPPGACEQGLRRKAAIEADRNRVHDLDWLVLE